MITEAGTDPNVAALVYIAAFVPDKGESVNTLIEGFPKDGPQPPILPPQDGFLLLDREKFHDSFAADVDAESAAFMADSQVPWGVDALGGTISEAAWASKPSWSLITTDDRMIPPPPSARCLDERAQPLRRLPPATRSTCRSRQPWLTSFRRLLRGEVDCAPRPALAGIELVGEIPDPDVVGP